MSSRTLSALEGDPIRAINGKFANIRTQSQNAAVNGQMLKTVTNSPTIEIQFTGDVNINNDMDVDDLTDVCQLRLCRHLTVKRRNWEVKDEA